MWEVLKRTPRGSIHPRKFNLLLATILMASFGYIFATPASVGAVTDASWNDDTVIYQGKAYTNASNVDDLPPSIAENPAIYQYLDTSKDPDVAHFIYFSNAEAQSEKEAIYIRYTLNPPNDYTNETGKKTISVAPVPASEQATVEDSGSSCTIDGIGWIVCPLMNGIAEGMDFIFERIRSFLVVQPMTTSVDNPVYRIWQVSRDLANIAFVIGFLVIIYSYIVGGGFSGYEIRKIIPRLVIAAILINISYVICAVAVDISNIAGYGVNQLFETVRDNTLTGSVGGDEENWTSVTTWVLAGGTGTIAGGTILIASIGGAATGLWFLLAPFLLGAALVVMVTFLILAARQAIIVLAIAIAPLAFAAFILPNTEKWFEKWRSLFFTMLIMFPAFAAVFGGAQLAGELIIRMAAANGSIELIILGLGVMAAPLAITPLLLKLGGGLLNRIGGIINNSEKGLLDRYKNYNKERLEDFRAAQNKRNATRDENGNLTLGKNQLLRRSAYRQNYKKHNRQRLRDANNAYTNSMYEDNDNGIETVRSMAARRFANAAGRDYDPSFKYGSGEIADVKHRSDALHENTEARHKQHWNEKFDIQNSHFDQALFNQRVNTLTTGDKAKLAENRMETAWSEMQAGKDPYQAAGIQGPTTATLKAQIDGIQKTAQEISFEGLKKAQAEIVIKGNEAEILSKDATIRAYAGGVGGENGANRVYAKAKSEIVSAYLDDVKASRSVLSEYSLNELIELHQGHKTRRGEPATSSMVDAAMQEIMLSKGNNWAFQKTKDYIASRGMHYDEDTNKYYEDAAKTVEITDQEVIERRRDEQQMFVDSVKNSKLSIKSLSGTDRGNLESGTFTVSSQGAIHRDIRDQKINANRLAETDIDELMRMVQVLRDDGVRGSLNEPQREALIKEIEFATDPNNPQISSRIATREKEMMGVIAEYLRHDNPMTNDQKWTIESVTQTSVPTNFVPDQPYGRSAAISGDPNDEPYGPDGRTSRR